jgi:hypothetical protein
MVRMRLFLMSSQFALKLFHISHILSRPAMLQNDIKFMEIKRCRVIVDSNTIILKPNKYDILCGRALKRKYEHPGNIALRNYIESKKAACNYTQLETNQQSVVIGETITHFKEMCRFLVEDTTQKGFRKADNRTIRRTVHYCFNYQYRRNSCDDINTEGIILYANDNDILCEASSHRGNQAFQDYVAKVVATCNHKRLTTDKRYLIDQIVEHFKSTSRFLVRDTGWNGYRVVVDNRKIKKKVENCFNYFVNKMSDGNEGLTILPYETNLLQTTNSAATSDTNTMSEETINDRDRIQVKVHPKYTEWTRLVEEEKVSDAGRTYEYTKGEVNADDPVKEIDHFSSTSADTFKQDQAAEANLDGFQHSAIGRKTTEAECDASDEYADGDEDSIREDQAAEANLDDFQHSAIGGGGKTMEADYDVSDEDADGDEGDDDANSVSSTKSYYRDLCVRLTFALEKRNAMVSQTRKENQRLKEAIAQLSR